MTDVAQMPTELLKLPALDSAPISQPEEDPFVADLNDLFSQHRELRRLYKLALAEIEHLNKALADLRQGHGVQVVIEGKRFVLDESIHLVKDALEQPMHGKNGLDDSFVL